MEVLREAPKSSTFVPLLEHQSTTPASFYSGSPVLHYYSDRSKLIVLEHEIDSAPAFAPILTAASPHHPESETQTNGTQSHQNQQKVVDEVDVWVTSDKLFIYSNAASAGVSIPYPSISLHAIQTLPNPAAIEQQGVFMQLIASTNEPMGEDVEPESISITIIPTASAAPAEASELDPAEDKPEQTPVQAMFSALSNCSNLHPDPVDPGEEEGEEEDGSRLFQAGLALPGTTDGGLPPAMPGSGGWITAENMHEFVDEDGNWIEGEDEEDNDGDGNETLGAGAGSVRPRDDAEAVEDGDETKWRRTS